MPARNLPANAAPTASVVTSAPATPASPANAQLLVANVVLAALEPTRVTACLGAPANRQVSQCREK